MKSTALIIFVLTYILLLALPKWRYLAAAAMGTATVALGVLPIGKVFGAIDWNVLMMICGTMGIVSLFIESKMPALLADLLINKTPNVRWAILALSLFAGIISAFVDNVATVLMVAPIALTIAKKLDISPVPAIISISVFSNLQGAATLVGDTTAILLGGYAGMDFFDFFVCGGRPGMFWIIQISSIVSALVLYIMFKKETAPVSTGDTTKPTAFFPSALLIAMILLLICASFIKNKPEITQGLICIGLMALGLVWSVIKKHEFNGVKAVLKDIDYSTLLLLAGLFIVIAGITEVGIIEDISGLFIKFGSGSVFIIYSLLVWGSVLFSAFIDNIPYVATMLPVVAGIARGMGIDPTVLYFGLLSGATLGGNLTPIGASANITSLGILKKAGYEVKTGEFMKLSVPFTMAAVITGYILVWVIFGI